MATFFGDSGAGAGLGIAADFAYFFKAVCTLSGNVTDGQVYWQSGGATIKLGVYADSSGVPGAKLGEATPIVLSGGAGTKTTTYPSPFAVVNGTTYWLAWVCNSNPTLGGGNAAATAFRFLASTYPALPSSAAGSSASSLLTGSVQAGVTAGGGGGSTFIPQIVIV